MNDQTAPQTRALHMASNSLPANVVAIGNEIVDCARIARLIERYDERFLRRVFTNVEIIVCSSFPDPNRAYSEVWAAKEAVAKSLGNNKLSPEPSSSTFRFWDIEIRLGPNQQRFVQLTGNAKSAAKQFGIHDVLVSTSSTRSSALATAIAIRNEE